MIVSNSGIGSSKHLAFVASTSTDMKADDVLDEDIKAEKDK